MNVEKVSIIIPCFNNATYIGDAIRSALSQTYPEIEVIVIDDGSTDGSDAVIARFGGSIVHLRQENSGACVARNRGLDVANGTWIKFLDGDDILMPDCVERQIAVAQGRSAVIFGDFNLLHEDGHVEPHPTHEASSGLSKGDKAGLKTFFYSLVLISTTLYPVHILRRIGGFDPLVKRGQEQELHLRLYGNGVDFEYQPLICFSYREHFSLHRISVSIPKVSHFRYRQNFVSLLDLMRNGPRRADWEGNRKVLGIRAWRTGRSLLRAGETTRAEEFFALSRSLCGSEAILGSGAYKYLVRLFGPIMAERVSTLAYHLRKPIKKFKF